MAPTRIILDCDPGYDDVVALLLAARHPDVELLAVTTVAGNQTLDKVTRNALAVATALDLDVPVAAGADRPLVADLVVSTTHGASGLDGVSLPEPARELDPRHAVDLIVETVMAEPPGTVTLVPIGPLTNIALAVRREPRIVERVREVVFMGGGYATGNSTAVAEFNVHTDPEAARIVVTAGWPVTMIGLDLTFQARATDDVLERAGRLTDPAGRLLAEVLGHFTAAYRRNGHDHAPVHDACAVAYAIDPTLMETITGPLDVELTGTLTRGMTVLDRRVSAGDDGVRTRAASVLDRQRFWDLVLGAFDGGRTS